MLKSWFITTIRRFAIERRNSIINIIGLSISISAALIIGLYVYRETAADRFHKNFNRIFCVSLDDEPYTPYITGEVFMNNLPEIASYTRVQLWDLKFNTIKYNNNSPQDIDGIIRADSNFFAFFGFTFIKGDPATCLFDPHAIVLTESTASKIFGTDDPVGKELSYNKGQIILNVTGVIKDPPSNSTLRFNAVMPISSMSIIYPPYQNSGPFFWNYDTFLMIRDCNLNDLEKKAKKVLIDHLPSESITEAKSTFSNEFRIKLKPISEIYFESKFEPLMHHGNRKSVYVFTLIGILILIVAIVNFINLNVATIINRNKELNIKRILGGSINRLVTESTAESIFLAFISLIISLVIGQAVLMYLNNIESLDLNLVFFSLPAQFLILIGGSILFGIISGIYPSIKLVSNFSNSIVPGKIILRANMLLPFLITFQFAVSIGLIISAIMITKQYRYITNINPGFNVKNIIYFNMGAGVKQNFDSFIEILSESPYIERIANAKYPFYSNTEPFELSFSCNGDMRKDHFSALTADTGFMELLGLKFTTGQTFSNFIDRDHAIIINRSAFRNLNCGNDMLNLTLPDNVHNISWRVVGIVEDFNFRTCHYPIGPFIFYFTPGDLDMTGLYLRLSTNNADQLKQACNFITDSWNKFAPDEPLRINFLDQEIENLYTNEKNYQKFITVFALFAVFISLIGLYGISSFVLEKRTKEIGIRKVNGASDSALIRLLVIDFMKWIVLGFIIISPIAGLLLNQWLRQYAYRASLSWWIYVLAGTAAFILAILTIGVKTWRISRSNPAQVLKYE